MATSAIIIMFFKVIIMIFLVLIKNKMILFNPIKIYLGKCWLFIYFG